MASIRDRRPRQRIFIRVVAAVAFVTGILLYVAHQQASERAASRAVDRAVAELKSGRARAALADGVDVERTYGTSAPLSRVLWAALMNGGGSQGRDALRRGRIAYRIAPEAAFRLLFSKDGHFLAAIDGSRIDVWSIEDGTHVLTTRAGDRFVGFWRIGARFFGLLASYQYYNLVASAIELPDGFHYEHPGKDIISGAAPGGDWGYHLPSFEKDRTDYPVELINLHTGEKREVDADFDGIGLAAMDAQGTRIATSHRNAVSLWDSRRRVRLATMADAGAPTALCFAKSYAGLIIVRPARVEFHDPTTLYRGRNFSDGSRLAVVDPDTGHFGWSMDWSFPVRAVADDGHGQAFAIATDEGIDLYLGPASPGLSAIAAQNVSRVPATSH